MLPDKVHVRAQLNPFSSDGKVFIDLEHGLTLSEITKTVTGGASVPGQLVIHIDDAVVADDESSGTIVPAPGSWVVIKVRPTGGGGDTDKAQAWLGVGSILTFALGITLMATGVGAPFGIQLMFSAAGMAAAAVGIGAMDKAATDPLKSTENALSIRGGRNPTPKSTDKIPVVYGKHLITPFNGARPYTAIAGDYGTDQYVTQMFCLGVGPLKVSNLKLGETMLATNAGDVRNGSIPVTGDFTVEFLQIRQDGTVPAGYGKTIVEDSPGVEITYANGFDGSTPIAALWKTTQKETSIVEVDVLFPSGLYYYKANGTRMPYWCDIEVRCRPAGATTAWSSCTLLHTFNVTAERASSMRYTASMALPSVGEWDIGIRRLTIDDPTEADAENGQRHASVFAWSAFRSIRLDDPVDESILPKCVFVSFKIKATKKLNGPVDQFNCIAEAVYPVYSGSGSGPTAWADSVTGTTNPAAAYLYTLRSDRVNPRPWADSRIDWARLEAWYATCATKGWTVNAVSASHTSTREMLARIAACGRASPVLRDGLASVVVDEPKTVIAQHFTPRNIKSFSWSKGFEDLPYGYRVSWLNAADGYAENERTVPYDEYTEAEAEAKLEAHPLWGVDNATLAYKQTRYAMAVRKLRSMAFVIETDPEGLVCEEGDLALLSHDEILVGSGWGRAKSVTLNEAGNIESVLLDEYVTMEGGKSYAIRFRLPTGESLYFAVVNAEAETNVIEPAGTVAGDYDIPGSVFSFGEAGLETLRCIVSAHEGTGDKGVRVYLVPEAPAVHTADSGTIPDFVSFITRPPVDETVDTDLAEILAMVKHQENVMPTIDISLYIRSITVPVQPAVAEPEGWTSAIPSGSNPLWSITATKSKDGIFLVNWSVPTRVGSGGAVVIGTTSPPPFVGLEGDIYRDSYLGIEWVYQYAQWISAENFADSAVTPREKARIQREMVIVKSEYEMIGRLSDVLGTTGTPEYADYAAAYQLLNNILYTEVGSIPPVLSDLTTVSSRDMLGADITAIKNSYEQACAQIQAVNFVALTLSASEVYDVEDDGLYDGTLPLAEYDDGDFELSGWDSELEVTEDDGAYDGSDPALIVDDGDYDGEAAAFTFDDGDYSVSATFTLPASVVDDGVFTLLD